MSESEKPEEPKLVIDDDWKEQVAKEKQAAAEGETNADESKSVPAAESRDQESAAAEQSGAAPPASFEVLISMMFTQGMAMLGQIPDPVSGESSVNKPYAKHSIDTLEMLGEKTKGNLSDDESKMLSEALHALRMAYVSVQPS